MPTNKPVVKRLTRPSAAVLPGVDAALKPAKRAPLMGGQTKAQRQEAGRLGGKHRAARGTGHTWSKAEASAAGKKGKAAQMAAKASAKTPKAK